jgi:hypothetical protein
MNVDLTCTLIRKVRRRVQSVMDSFSKQQIIILSAFCLSWLIFILLVAASIPLSHDPIHGGTYSWHDGNWAEWSSNFIFHHGKPFDLSPYNAFAGMGSMHLPNLPWANPGAIMLNLPLDRSTAHTLSYSAYMIVLCVSIVLLARAMGFSWITGSIGAQIHIIVLFPPFSKFFIPMEWYSAAPIGSVKFLIGDSSTLWAI